MYVNVAVYVQDRGSNEGRPAFEGDTALQNRVTLAMAVYEASSLFWVARCVRQLLTEYSRKEALLCFTAEKTPLAGKSGRYLDR